MSVSQVQERAFRNSPDFKSALDATVLSQAAHIILITDQGDMTPAEADDLEYAIRVQRGEGDTQRFLSPLITDASWSATFDAWEGQIIDDNNYAILTGVQRLWPIFSGSVRKAE